MCTELVVGGTGFLFQGTQHSDNWISTNLLSQGNLRIASGYEPCTLFATGPCEQQGWAFYLNAASPCATLPDGRCVSLFRDRVTGFHWIAERLKALPTIKGRRAMISRCLQHPRQAGIEVEYVLSLDCSKQRTNLEDAESLPTQPLHNNFALLVGGREAAC